MRTRHRWFLVLAAASLAACSRAESTETAATTVQAPVLRQGPVRKLLLARPFTVAEPYAHIWRREQPPVSAGWILVIEVDPSMTEPHQRAMPVLLVGDQTVECVNFGQPLGNVVALLPAAVDGSGIPQLDWAENPTWFGPPDLPESVDSSWIARARAGVRAEQRTTFAAAEIAEARERGGAVLAVADRVELERAAARLILEYSPRERELAESLLVPLIK
jgi:hypothetical protein